jgi:hypothetical protein
MSIRRLQRRVTVLYGANHELDFRKKDFIYQKLIKREK